MKTESFFAMVAGTAFGVALGLLFAPDKGSETRRKVRETATGLYADATDSFDELKDSALKSTSRLRARARIAGRELRGLMDTLAEQGENLKDEARQKILAKLEKLEAALEQVDMDMDEAEDQEEAAEV
ncbi:MAG: YtxH domain-containing protein [Bacteroidales bacterium]|nr:YtxH domain-containing protein [Bacteroidales bacterium]MBQ9889348.1 YtxH domain-containing protein [Bacteroidales bacterium]MCR4571888.1 YtxH domain-containing protein [Bacteroidales bacterium]